MKKQASRQTVHISQAQLSSAHPDSKGFLAGKRPSFFPFHSLTHTVFVLSPHPSVSDLDCAVTSSTPTLLYCSLYLRSIRHLQAQCRANNTTNKAVLNTPSKGELTLFSPLPCASHSPSPFRPNCAARRCLHRSSYTCALLQLDVA